LILKKNFSSNTISDDFHSKSEKVRAKPIILLEDARGKGSQWNYTEKEARSKNGLRLDIMIRIGKAVSGGLEKEQSEGSHVVHLEG